jgi:hypothetical protein
VFAGPAGLPEGPAAAGPTDPSVAFDAAEDPDVPSARAASGGVGSRNRAVVAASAGGAPACASAASVDAAAPAVSTAGGASGFAASAAEPLLEPLPPAVLPFDWPAGRPVATEP